MRIRVLDHLIIGDDRYFSFADEGLIDQYGAAFDTRRAR
jgi:DNA repair protein RadC